MAPPTGPGPATPAAGDRAFCAGCGRPSSGCGGCTGAYDPHRFCEACGRRLTVQVTPVGWSGVCRACGRTTGS